ncbi:MAG TPA: hypothetical protein ENJ95_10610 [Bacteroidetes bacterium]|nr:hypothetical protein [Bacteroidota bacterium]
MSSKNNHTTTELARLFFIEMMKIHGRPEWTYAQKTDATARLLELLFIEVTKQENIQFTTLFARISFACHKFHINKRTQYWVHFFRKKHRSLVPPDEQKQVYQLGQKTLAQCIAGLFGEAIPEDVEHILPTNLTYEYREIKVKAFRKKARVAALQDDETNSCLLARDEANPSEPVLVKYNIADRNAPFNPTIRQIRSAFGFPVVLSLLDVEVDDKGVYRPRAIVVEPDYLLDVSAVANCFQGRGAEPVVYLLNKYLPYQQSIPLILGNIANFFLDELMHNPRASFKKTFPKVFKTNPLTFSLLPDAAIREIYQKSQKHWVTLQMMAMQGMKKSGIEPKDCYLEPSFYDEIHGLQGRLDILFLQKEKSAIVELKSGKPFMPNRYGIGASHFIQTLLYDLMVRSVFDEKIDPMCYILYSGLDSNQLRYAPPVKAQQNEALQVRNQLVAIDRHLAGIQKEVENVPLFQKINTARFPHIKGYLTKNIEQFEKVYASLNDLERRYFNAFSGLIAREHKLAKTGIQGVDKANGLAALWLDTFAEKEANFQVLKALTIKENKAGEEEATIVFNKTKATNHLANFRPGDIAVLYPVHQSVSLERSGNPEFTSGPQSAVRPEAASALSVKQDEKTQSDSPTVHSPQSSVQSEAASALSVKQDEKIQPDSPTVHSPQSSVQSEAASALSVKQDEKIQPDPNQTDDWRTGGLRTEDWRTDGLRTGIRTQIFKVSILAITDKEVKVSLRYKQFNRAIFEEFEMWNLEHDQMDMSFNAMYQGLFRFAQSERKKRELLLGTRAPEVNNTGADGFQKNGSEGLTEEQQRILQKMIRANGYFLLWGPPGTGKTSKMLKNYARWVFENTDENLLLLAYTNRAVDEICAALDNLGEEVKASYIRIGSRHSTGKAFENQLLSKKIEQVNKREELREVLGRHRIFVSTLASLTNKLQLLQLKKFRRVAIDEASQILEPMLVGLLPHFEQFVLIGDHKQLPAVVVQDEEASAVKDEKLKGIGLLNLRNSLFERLYKKCRKNGWHWAFDQLSHQGRMHADIMRFPAEHFYEGKLKILPKNIAYAKRQQAPISTQTADLQEDWLKEVAGKRIAFVPTKIDWQTPSRKTNRFEAERIAALVNYFQTPQTGNRLPNTKSPIPPSFSIGIITPYRAQIAQIQEVLKEQKTDCRAITVDTVERYQGGARDIILISLCTNAASQMDSLVSLSEEGVDRKLNVALTRARERVVILGNEKILAGNEVYRKLMAFCRGLR